MQSALSAGRRVCYSRAMAQTLEDLDGRATALEKAQGDTTDTLRWVVAKLGSIQAIQDEHTLRLERLETKVDGIESKLDGLERKLDGLMDVLPSIVADAVRAARK